MSYYEDVASFLEDFDERARLSNARYSDGDDEDIFREGFSQLYGRRDVERVLWIKHNNSLEEHDERGEIYLNIDDLRKRPLRRLGYILSRNTTLRALRLWRTYKRPREEDCWLLAGIRANRSMVELYLSRCSLGSKLCILAPFLTHNPNLEELELKCCGLGSADVDLLAYCLFQRSTESLQELNINGNNIGENDLDRLCLAVKKSRCLKRLGLGENGIIRVQAALSLAKLLSSNESALEELDVSKNALSADDALLLIDSLETNDKLQTLNLKGNEAISEEGWAAIAKRVLQLVCNESSPSMAAKSNHTLASLGSPYNPNVVGFNRRGRIPTDYGVPFDRYLDADGTNLVRSALRLNYGPESESIKARRKVVWGHVRGVLYVGEETIDISLMPRVIALIGLSSRCNSCQKESAKLLQPLENYDTQGAALVQIEVDSDEEEVDDGPNSEVNPPHPDIDAVKLGAVYRIIRARPELCFEKHSAEEKLRLSREEIRMLRAENERLAEEIKQLQSQLSRL